MSSLEEDVQQTMEVNINQFSFSNRDSKYFITFNNSFNKLLEKGYFWLSQTPDVPGSFGWDAACKNSSFGVTVRQKTYHLG